MVTVVGWSGAGLLLYAADGTVKSVLYQKIMKENVQPSEILADLGYAAR